MARRKDPLTEASDTPLDEAIPVEPETLTSPADAVPPPAVQRRSGMLGPVLGGALAAIGGFGLSHFDAFGLNGPDPSADLAALSARVDDALATLDAGQSAATQSLREVVDTLAARVSDVEARPPAVDPAQLADLDQRLLAIEGAPAGSDASTVALAAKLADLERRLASQPAGGVDQAKVDEALARLAKAEAESTERAEEARLAAEQTANAAALARLTDVVATGAGFEAELAAVGDAALQAALQPHVAGVATLQQLQADFPDAARLSLQLDLAARDGDSWGTRLTDFLAAQTGARSLTPRDGDTPDAILSRAEFALTEGRLADALAELQSLAPDIRAPFDLWMAQATARLAVITALEGT